MRPLSASEAIGPALERTKDVLTRPFRWQTFLKLAAVAFFAEIGGGFNFPSGAGNTSSSSSSSSSNLLASSSSLKPETITILVIVGLVFFVIGLVLFYISSRLQLVLVELVATRQTTVAPMWRRYSSLVWRWIGLKLLYFFGVFLLTLLLVGPFLFHYGRSGFSSFHPSFVNILLLIVGGLGILVVLIAVYLLLRDFALPYFALEGLSISDTISRVRLLLAVDFGQVVLYLVLRVLLGLAIAIATEIAALIILLVSAIPFAIVGGVLWYALHGGAVGTAILIGCAVVGGLVFLGWMVCVGIALFGPLFMYFRAYALYFLGGRYPLLGDLLDRSTPPPTFAYAAGYPPPPTFQPPPTEPPPAPPLPEIPPAS